MLRSAASQGAGPTGPGGTARIPRGEARARERKDNALLQLFKESFVHDATSNHITNALVGKTSKDSTELASKHVMEQQWHWATANTLTAAAIAAAIAQTSISVLKLPQDFFPQKATLTDQQVRNRISSIESFDMRTGGNRSTPIQAPDFDECKIMVLKGRKLVMEHGKTLMLSWLIALYVSCYPNDTYKNGTKRVRTFDDFNEYVRQTEMSPDLLQRIFDLAHAFWEKGNGPPLEIEDVIMVTFRWSHSECCDKNERVRITKGGCIKKLLVKEKHHILERLKITVK